MDDLQSSEELAFIPEQVSPLRSLLVLFFKPIAHPPPSTFSILTKSQVLFSNDPTKALPPYLSLPLPKPSYAIYPPIISPAIL